MCSAVYNEIRHLCQNVYQYIASFKESLVIKKSQLINDIIDCHSGTSSFVCDELLIACGPNLEWHCSKQHL